MTSYALTECWDCSNKTRGQTNDDSFTRALIIIFTFFHDALPNGMLHKLLTHIYHLDDMVQPVVNQVCNRRDCCCEKMAMTDLKPFTSPEKKTMV